MKIRLDLIKTLGVVSMVALGACGDKEDGDTGADGATCKDGGWGSLELDGPLINPHQLMAMQSAAETDGIELLVLDLTTGEGTDDSATHRAGHIPGALFVNWRANLNEFPFPVLTEGSAGALYEPPALAETAPDWYTGP